MRRRSSRECSPVNRTLTDERSPSLPTTLRILAATLPEPIVSSLLTTYVHPGRSTPLEMSVKELVTLRVDRRLRSL